MKIVYCIALLLLEITNTSGIIDLNLIRRIRTEVTTYQSSIFSQYDNPQDFNSDKAIDGIQNYSIDTCKCCSVTDGDSPSWWQIDLAQKYLIGAVQIFGRKIECYVGNFGTGCSHNCHCSDNKACNQVTGQCETPGCLAGWQGEACDTVCGHRSFGGNCLSLCHCFNDSSCNAVSGECDMGKCDPGWRTSKCDTKCSYRHFGEGCNNTCHCENGSNCNHVSGYCESGLCEKGWILPTCSEEKNLIKTLKKQVKTQMSSDAENTNSTLAVDGLLGPDPDICHCCSITSNSPLSWWMLDLGKRYPLKSIVIYGRNKEDSYHHLAGFKLLLHNRIEDKPDSYMYNESLHTISDNKYVFLVRNKLVRDIKIERPGVLTLCQVVVVEGSCKVGSFGDECSQNCYCADNKPCDQSNGYCQYAICKLGWRGKACNESCPKNTFGEGCNQVCHCHGGTCSSDYGICPDNGLEADRYSAEMVGGLVAGCFIVIVSLVLLGVLFHKYRLKRDTRNESENCFKNIHRNMTRHDDETTCDTIVVSRETRGHGNEVFRNENVSEI